jgi:hypothetical protein
VAAALWLLAWGFVGVSIIVATTSGPPAGAVDAVVQSVGEFYLTAVRTLRQFAMSTTVSPRWVDVAYAAFAVITVLIHLFLLSGDLVLHRRRRRPGRTVAAHHARGSTGGGSADRLGRLPSGRTLTLSTIGVGVVLLPFGYALVGT